VERKPLMDVLQYLSESGWKKSGHAVEPGHTLPMYGSLPDPAPAHRSEAPHTTRHDTHNTQRGTVVLLDEDVEFEALLVRGVACSSSRWYVQRLTDVCAGGERGRRGAYW
jgi:hypothetical protein